MWGFDEIYAVIANTLGLKNPTVANRANLMNYLRLLEFSVAPEIYRQAVKTGASNTTISTNTQVAGGKNLYNNLTINSGVTLSINSGSALILLATETITINGTVTVSGRGLAGAPRNTALSTNGTNGSSWTGDSWVMPSIGGSAGSGGGSANTQKGGDGGSTYVAGGLGATWTIGAGSAVPTLLSTAPIRLLDGMVGLERVFYGAGGGSGGAYSTAGNYGGAGGAGGGLLVVMAPTIVLGPSSALYASGADGEAAASLGQGGGGGGGGGGTIIVAGSGLSIAGTRSASGGAGGAGFGVNGRVGGAGGAGVVSINSWG